MSNSLHATEIYNGLWLGDIHSANDLQFLNSKSIDYIVNCTATLTTAETKRIFRIPVKDNQEMSEIYKMYKLLDKSTRLIAKLLEKGNVLVHCHAGRQRSATVIVAFLMRFGISLKEAYKCVKSKRPTVFTPLPNFDKALRQYENDLSYASVGTSETSETTPTPTSSISTSLSLTGSSSRLRESERDNDNERIFEANCDSETEEETEGDTDFEFVLVTSS